MSTSSLLRAAAVAAMTVCTLSSQARAASWTAPAVLDPTFATNASVAIDGSGDAMAVWLAADRSVISARRPAGGSWTQPATLAPAPDQYTSVTDVQVVMDSAGDAAAAWEWSHGNSDSSVIDTKVQAAAGTASSGLGPIQTLASGTDTYDSDNGAHNGDEYSAPLVAIDAAGTATVAWLHEHDAGVQVTSSYLNRPPGTSAAEASSGAPGGAWSATHTLASGTIDANEHGTALGELYLAAGGNGRTVAAWNTYTNSGQLWSDDTVRGAVRSNGTWGSATDVSPTSDGNQADEVSPAATGVGPGGEVSVVWRSGNVETNPTDIHISRADAGGTFSEPGAPYTLPAFAYFAADAAVNADGTVTAVYGGADLNVDSLTQAPDGRWTQRTAGPGDLSAFHPGHLVQDETGAQTIYYQTADDPNESCSGCVVLQSRSGAGVAWDPPTELVGRPVDHPLAAAGDGHALALLSGTDMQTGNLLWTEQTPLAPVFVTGGPSGTVNSRSATFTFDNGQQDPHYQCSLDAAPPVWSDCSSPQDYSGLQDGQHTFSVRPWDPQAQIAGAPTSQSWTVDATPPETTITSGPSGQTTDTHVTFGFSSEAGATLLCKLDGADYRSCTSPTSYDVGAGQHTFAVKAVDGAGNEDASPATRSFSVVPPAGNGPTAPGGVCEFNARNRAVKLPCFTNSVGPEPPCPDGQWPDRGVGPFVVVAETTKACFRPRQGRYVSTGPVKVNGMHVTLPQGGEVILDPRSSSLTTTTPPAIRLVDWLPAFQMPIPIAWSSSSSEWSPTPKQWPFLKALPVKLWGLRAAIPQITLESDNENFAAGSGGATLFKVDLAVPNLFNTVPTGGHTKHTEDDFGIGLHGEVETGNGNGFQARGQFAVRETLLFGAFAVKNLTADIDTTSQSLDLGGTLVFPGGEPEVTVTAGVSTGLPPTVSIDADGLQKPILGSGFFLQDLHVGLGRNTNLTPYGRVSNYTLNGGGRGTFGPEIKPDSFLFRVFHTPAFITLKGDVTFGFPTRDQTWYLLAGGEGQLLSMTMAKAGVQLSGTGAIDIWGSFGLGIGGYGFSAEVPRGQGWYDHGHVMQLHGFGRVKLPLLPEADGEVLINQLGATACRTTDGRGQKLNPGQSTGYNYVWGGSFGTIEDSCDLGHLTRPRPSARAASTNDANEQQVGVPEHTALTELAVAGVGAPPKVTVTGPHGETVSTPAGPDGIDSGQFLLFQDPNTNTTHVAIRQPAAGTWTITRQTGSVPIESVGQAMGLPVPKVSGRLSGCRPRCTLRYHLRPIAGQRVVLSEIGGGVTRTIATVTRAKGTVRFTPSPGNAGTRLIVADVLQDGHPRAHAVVARFHATSGRPPAPRRLRARRRGTALTVTWQRVAGAYRYIVTVQHGPRSISVSVRSTHLRLKLAGKGRRVVRVSAVNALGVGRAAVTRVR